MHAHCMHTCCCNPCCIPMKTMTSWEHKKNAPINITIFSDMNEGIDHKAQKVYMVARPALLRTPPPLSS